MSFETQTLTNTSGRIVNTTRVTTTYPAIVKIQTVGSANDLDCLAGFDIILVNN